MKFQTPVGLVLISPLAGVLLSLTISHAGALTVPPTRASGAEKHAGPALALREAAPNPTHDPNAPYGRKPNDDPWEYPELGTGPGQDDPLGAHDDPDEETTEEYNAHPPHIEGDTDDEEEDEEEVQSSNPPEPETPAPKSQGKGPYGSSGESEGEDSEDEEEEQSNNKGGSSSGQGKGGSSSGQGKGGGYGSSSGKNY